MDSIDFVVVGNLTYDVNYFRNRDGEELKEVCNYGGATIYSAIPASLFVKVGLVAKVGEDYDLDFNEFKNINTSYIQRVVGKTTMFKQEYVTEDGQERTFQEFINPNTVLKVEDIPDCYLKAKYIHVCTNYPKTQLEIVKYLRRNSKAILSVDTLEDYYYDDKLFPIIKESFDLVDIAYIDKEFKKLYDCDAKIKILKLGSEGCKYISSSKTFQVGTVRCDNVVDKTGAGDCVTGVFGALKVLGYSDEEALQKAVNVATESIKDYGMFHLYDKEDLIKKM